MRIEEVKWYTLNEKLPEDDTIIQFRVTEGRFAGWWSSFFMKFMVERDGDALYFELSEIQEWAEFQ